MSTRVSEVEIEVELLLLGREWHNPEHVVIKFLYHEHWSREVVSSAMLFIADIPTETTHPDFTLFGKFVRSILFGLKLFLNFIPRIKILHGYNFSTLTGKISSYQSKAQIVLNDANQLSK